MLTTIDKPIRNRALVCLENREAESLYKALDVVLRSYNKAGYYVNKIRCDREFKPIMDEIKDNLDIDLDYPPQGDHVPEAERNNQTTGERIRAGFHQLPYKMIPWVMLKALVMLSTSQLNFFPPREAYRHTIVRICLCRNAIWTTTNTANTLLERMFRRTKRGRSRTTIELGRLIVFI